MTIAENLGKTLRELEDIMTDEELMLWSAYHQVKSEEERKAIDKAKRAR